MTKNHEIFIGRLIIEDGELWEIGGVGTTWDDGTTHCHLVSMGRGRKVANGWHPCSIGADINLDNALPMAPTTGATWINRRGKFTEERA
jgi:hypothetical protein